MKKIKQRLISFILMLAVSITLAPAFSVYAEEDAGVDMMDFLYELTMNIDNENELKKEIIWKMVEVSFEGADKAGVTEKLLKAAGKNIADKSVRELLETLEKTGGSKVFKALDAVKDFHEAYENMDGVVKAYNEYKKSMDIYGKAGASARAFQNAFELFSNAIKTVAPGLGHLVSVPIETGAKLLDGPITALIGEVKDWRWNSVLGVAAADPGEALKLAEAYGLRDEFKQLMEKKGAIKKQTDALSRYAGLNEDYIKLYDALYGTDKWKEVAKLLTDINSKNIEIDKSLNNMANVLRDLNKYGKENGLFDENGDYIGKKGDEATGNGGNDLEDDKDNAKKQSSPLTLNIDGSGIETLPLAKGVYFDHQGTGFRIKTGWVAPGSGLLVRDINGNGVIDSGLELFGDNTILKSGQRAANGFEALKDLNEGDDGIFDARSAAYHELYLWFDRNGNGRTDPGELISLDEAGVVSINLDYSNSDYVDVNGNAFKQTSIGMLHDGTAVEVVDIWFVRDVKDSQAADQVEVSEEIAALPRIRGLGTTHSLQQAMMLDSGGQLQALVEQFIAEADETARRKLVPQIIHKWTGKTTNLEAVEALTGTKYTGGTGTNAMAVINRGFDRFAGIIYEVLMSQSHYWPLYDRMVLDVGGGLIDFSLVADALLQEIAADRETGEKLLMDYLYNLHMLMITNDIDPVTFQERIAASDVRSAICAEAMNRKIIKAVSGDSKLTGSALGDMFLIYSSGNTIEGGHGDNIYIFGKAPGANTVNDIGGNHTIMLPVNLSDLTARPAAKNVELTAGNCTITLTEPTKGASYTIIFADGSACDLWDLVDASEIRTAEDLVNIREDLYGFYRLMSDIDMAGIEWTPAGTAEMPFGGLFDGNGHEIKNLTVDAGSSDYAGLFGVNSGIIRNVTLTGVDITGKNRTGGLAGQNRGTILNCSVSGGVTGNNYVGGLAGYGQDGRIEGSCAAGTVAGRDEAGGLVGYMSGGSVVKSFAAVQVSAAVDAGGFVGYSTGSAVIERSYATGNVSSGNYAGGFAGTLFRSTVRNCYAAGNVENKGTSAGFAGDTYDVAVIENCHTVSGSHRGLHTGKATVTSSYYNSDLTIDTENNEHGRSTEEMAEVKTYAGWDFVHVWVMGDNGYPVLRGFEVKEMAEKEQEKEMEEETAEEDVWIEISTAEQLGAVRDNLLGNYRLVSDIDMAGIAWMPAGTAATPFGGQFDGNGHKIKNLAVDLGSSDYVGLFGINSGTIRNITLTDMNITGSNYTGGLVGQNCGSILNCSMSGKVAGQNYVGGLIGHMNGGSIEKSAALADVSASSEAGGFAGYITGEAVIERSCAAGNILSGGNFGGFVGTFYNGTLKDCFAAGSSAGFTGYAHSSEAVIENCYTVSGSSEGLHTGTATVTNSYYNRDLAPDATNNAYGRTTEEMSKTETYIGWDFENIWVMGEDGYPVLREVRLLQEMPVQSAEYVTVTIINESGMPVETTSDRQKNGLFFIGDTIMLKADPADKWVFTEWQDKDGNTVSVEKEYSFVITGNTTLILVGEVSGNLKEFSESKDASELIIETEEESDESFTAG